MKIRALIVLAVAVLVGSCASPEADNSENNTSAKDKRNLPFLVKGVVEDGKLNVKFTPEMAEMLESSIVMSSTDGIQTKARALNKAMTTLGAYKMERLFRNGGKYEGRRRRAGLHLWYTISFDKDIDVLTAANEIATLDGVTFIEGSLIIQPEPIKEPIEATESDLRRMQQSVAAENPDLAPVYFFNDPWLPSQWHYQNYALRMGFIEGADINLFPAWGIETGKPEVIVAIMDGGIDYRHQDLAANMWINEAEKNGVAGVDDDNNGYVDDIYGFNFVNAYTGGKGAVTGDLHGTHVAGTVAAVNNNGIGVAGVAGGDGTAGSGVRLMSCQIFENSVTYLGNAEDAFAYGADNGAVISQNSWANRNLNAITAAMQAAIDYFVQYAGMDETGTIQVGPMKGGIVIFAAGNEGGSGLYMPGAYEGTFTVVAMGPNFQKAGYSNYGTWTQITAPGGAYSDYNESQVLSTGLNNSYYWMAGTSMACPHVSGIAALVVSKYGTAEKGFTSQQLWNLLLASTHDINQYNPSYIGQMGVGYIDAYKALTAFASGGDAPNPITALDITWMFDAARLHWTIPAQGTAGKAARYDILWSQTDLNGADLDNLPEGTFAKMVRVTTEKAGDAMTTKITGLEVDKRYYVAVVAVDNDGKKSALFVKSGSTIANRPPQVEGLPSNISLRASEQRSIVLKIYDIEEYSWTYSFTAGSSAATIKKDNSEQLTLNFNCTKAVAGNYTAKLTVTDEQGLANEIEIKYTINPNHAPVATSQNAQYTISGVGLSEQFNMNALFEDEDGDELKFEIKLSDASLVTLSKTDNILTIKSKKTGSTTMTITAIDPSQAKAECVVKLVCLASPELTLYPVPVKADGILNFRIGNGNISGDVDVAIYNTSTGARVFTAVVAVTSGTDGRVNISKLHSGNYRVVAKFEGIEISKNITKL